MSGKSNNTIESISQAHKYQTGVNAASKRVWAVGGGKGGVGKSLVTANVSICLALLGHKVTAIDLDLGGANLHTCLGIPIPEKTLSDFFMNKVSSIKDIIIETPINNLSIISGAQDSLGIANLKQVKKRKLLTSLSEIDADYIILDLGAGTTFNTLDFFISSDKGILTTLPEPTSIENTYRFIKSVYHRRLKAIEELFDISHLINEALNTKLGSSNIPANLVKSVIEIDPEVGNKLKEEIQKFSPKLIVNQVRTQADIDLGFSVQSICKRYFGINLDYIGYLEYDATVWQSVKKRRPLLLDFPNSRLVPNFEKIVHKLLGV